VNTDFYPVLVDKSDNGSLDVFIIPATAEAIRIISRAPVSADEHYALANLAVHNLVLSSDCRLGTVDRAFYQQLIAQHQAMDAITNNQTSRVALDSVIDFLRNRLSNNVPLLKLDVLQQRLAALHAEWAMSRALAYSALTAQQTDDFFSLASASQSLAGRLLQKIAVDSLHLGGINHYRTDSNLARIYQEARWNNLFGVA